MPRGSNKKGGKSIYCLIMAPRRAEWIDWRTSEAKKIVFNDLLQSRIPIDELAMPAEQCWERYRTLPAFAEVQFDQFKIRLKGHREQVGLKFDRAMVDSAAFEHDKLILPVKTHNARGEPVFHGSDAEKLLAQDVEEKKHEWMTLGMLQQSRPEYASLSGRQFKERVYQAQRLERYLAWYEDNRG